MSPLPTNVIRHSPLVDVVEGRLTDQLPTVKGYLSEATDVPLAPGSSRVGRYYVLHPFGGSLNPERALGEGAVDKDWTVQITAAAGTPRDALAVATLVDAAMMLWTPTFPPELGWRAGWFKPPDGYDPGPVQTDRDYTPHRYFLPLQYRTTITAT